MSTSGFLLSFAWPVGGLCLFGAAVTAYALFGDRARGRARCPACWQFMEGCQGLRCQACGHVVWAHPDLLRTRRHWILAALGALTCAAGGVLAVMT
jgi:hypothetical protein